MLSVTFTCVECSLIKEGVVLCGGGRRYLKVVGFFSSLFSRLREAYSEIIGTTDDC